MFESVLRVTSTREADWTISHESSQQRYADGVNAIQNETGGSSKQREGFGKMMFTRVFFPDGCGDFEHSRAEGTLNRLLGLPVEDVDEATCMALKRAVKGDWVGSG